MAVSTAHVRTSSVAESSVCFGSSVYREFKCCSNLSYGAIFTNVFLLFLTRFVSLDNFKNMSSPTVSS